MAQVIDRPQVSGPGTDLGGNWKVIVLNDNHNTFDGVAGALARHIPGVDLQRGYRYASEVHNSGLAVVWAGPLEPAELYRELLAAERLTMAPLERA